MSLPFAFEDTIRYGDLDANGHLNNVAVHGFFESARIAYVRSLLPGLSPQDPLGTIFAETRVRFRSPGFFPETLRTDIRPSNLRRSSVRLQFTMTAVEDDRLVAEGWGTIVGFDYDAGRAAPLSPDLADALRADGADTEPQED